MRVIHKKITYEYKILLVETKFNLCVIYLCLYYYMRNFCNLIGLEQGYFSLIWNAYMWKLQPFAGSSINK